jgi:hypothetical protein
MAVVVIMVLVLEECLGPHFSLHREKATLACFDDRAAKVGTR